MLLGDVLARRVPVSALWRYSFSLQRKKCCQQIIGLDDESFSIAVRIEAKELFVVNLSPHSLLFAEPVRLTRLARSLFAPGRYGSHRQTRCECGNTFC
jgi:hypothetical protein